MLKMLHTAHMYTAPCTPPGEKPLYYTANGFSELPVSSHARRYLSGFPRVGGQYSALLTVAALTTAGIYTPRAFNTAGITHREH